MSRFKNESQIDRFRRSLGLPIPGEENVETEFEVQTVTTLEPQEDETPEKTPAKKAVKKKKAEPEPSPRTAVSLSRLLERELSKDPEARKFIEKDRCLL